MPFSGRLCIRRVAIAIAEEISVFMPSLHGDAIDPNQS